MNNSDLIDEVQGRYSEGADTLLITCPRCRHTTHIHIPPESYRNGLGLKVFLGRYVCKGGINVANKALYDVCDKAMIITEIL